jgi:hypothetical protein
MLSILAFFAGLASLGFVLAEDPKPILPPTAAKAPYPQAIPTEPAPTLVKAPTSNSPEESKDQLGQFAQNRKPGEPQVQIDARCVQVPAGFVEESGLALDNTTPKTGELFTSLNQRETKMLTALLRASPGRLILAEPRIIVCDGQTGSIQTSGPVENVVTLVATTTNGKTEYVPQTLRLTSSHMTLKVTPKISKENGKILLRIERETTSVGEGIAVNKVERGDDGQTAEKPTIAASLNVNNAQVTVLIPDGETMVIGNTIASTRDKTQKSELLWVLTAHLVRGKQ